MKSAVRVLLVGLLAAFGLALTQASSPTTTPAARAATAPGYVTVLVGRGTYAKLTGGRLDPQVLTLDQVAPTLAAMGLWAAGNVVVTRTAEATRTVLSGNAYASWADWQRLASSYGWHVIDAGTYALGSDPATVDAQTCGTLAAFSEHGFADAWGTYAYPSGRYDAAAAATINACFAYARTYGARLNTGPDVPAPYSIRAESLDGGNCQLAGQPCASVFKRSYERPATVTARLSPGANQWGLVQFYHLVTGSRPRNGSAPAWDCTHPDWRYHWSNKAEFYCAGDFFGAVGAAVASWQGNVSAATPAQVALAWGRGNPNTP